MQDAASPRYQQVADTLLRDITTGKFQPGQRMPSEAALVKQFRTSRITIGRALRELKQRGWIDRIAGSGTYVSAQRASRDGQLFGLLIPDLGDTEIFDPICRGMAQTSQASSYALLWGHASSAPQSRNAEALELCSQFIERKVSGVFFAPVEHSPTKDEVNQTIASKLEKAGIPIVLLDRCTLPYPRRSRHDLVGIDNRRAGYMATEHLLKSGAQRVHFIGPEGAAPTVDARIAGFRDALWTNEAPLRSTSVHRLASLEAQQLTPVLKSSPADAYVCANDHIAGIVMHALLDLGKKVPEAVRIVGMDDVGYASLLPVPLTTVHQPCREIGEAAISAMLDRIAHPGMLTRDILLDCRLVVRRSCGGVLDE